MALQAEVRLRLVLAMAFQAVFTQDGLDVLLAIRRRGFGGDEGEREKAEENSAYGNVERGAESTAYWTFQEWNWPEESPASTVAPSP
jgi:hypothetical protein